MSNRKHRRHVDTRTLSVAKDLAKRASTNPKLQENLLSVAMSACLLALHAQELSAACKTAANAFDAMSEGDGGVERSKATQVLGQLAGNVLLASDGVFQESLESLVAIAIESLPNDERVRLLSTLAASAGLDAAQITLDYEVEEGEEPPEKPAEPVVIEGPERTYSRQHIEVFAEIAKVRRLQDFRVRVVDRRRSLEGFNGRMWFTVAPLWCNEEEAERVRNAVTIRVAKSR
jgi:hypothetical protein